MKEKKTGSKKDQHEAVMYVEVINLQKSVLTITP